MYFDTHAHLNDAKFDADKEDALRRCREAGVLRVVEIADAPADWDKAVALSRVRPEMIRCSLGLHPYHAEDWREEIAEALPKKTRLPEVVAIGEIGLDYVKSPAPHGRQQETFLRMLSCAWIAEKPVVLHCRGAMADLLHILEEFYRDKAKRGRFHGVLHCFSGDAREAVAAVRLGFALGVDGPVTYPKNDALREALAAAGLDALVLETDSPYLPPQSRRGQRNEPALLPEIARSVAAIFSAPVEEVARITTRNGEDLFGLTPPK